jgi:hypothetical protein
MNILWSDKLNEINNFINKVRYKNYKIMYHLTSKKNALSILKNNFNIKLSKMSAFGKGVNLSPSKKHLQHYLLNNNDNYIVTVLVKYDKLKFNPPYNWKKSEKNKEEDFFKKYGHSKPTYNKRPKGYEGMYWKSIFVISHNKYTFPLAIEKTSKYLLKNN